MEHQAPRIRIGIDVGGTFTHAVAIDAQSLELVGRAKVPTTHMAVEGVALGVVESLRQLLASTGIDIDQIVMIAHSTTQATNALLEGDVAPVGIVGMGRGASAWIARRQTAIRPMRLAPNRLLQLHHRFIRSEQVGDDTVERAIRELDECGAQVIVAAEAFSVDDPSNELRVCAAAEKCGMIATATHHVSQLHGLGIRTRTAVINACMIPRMLSTANMTEHAVRSAGISAPLMIMRSDGGVMDINEMRRRPIQTMLSGPAAGVAAALLYAHISDGVFLEVGGTSTDISVIKNGRTQIRSAEVGGQRLFVNTLDVRTVGVAGGSMAYLEGDRLVQVGPRSAHIANLPYLSFAEREGAAEGQTHEYEGDRFCTVSIAAQPHAVTPTCAANFLGFVAADDPAKGNEHRVQNGISALAKHLKKGEPAALAREILTLATDKPRRVVEALMRDYKLSAGVTRLIAGGGGGSAIVPFLAQRMGLAHETVANSDVISAIGVALAMIRDSVERTVIDPSEEDIHRIRAEALERVLRMGANAETVQVFVEVDTKSNLLRAIAEGSSEIKQQELIRSDLDEAERESLVRASMGDGCQQCGCVATIAGFEFWTAQQARRRVPQFLHRPRTMVRALDTTGTIRWACDHGAVHASTTAKAAAALTEFAESHTKYTDAGATIPRCFVFIEGRIINLSGLSDMPQVLNVLQIELNRFPQDLGCMLGVDLG